MGAAIAILVLALVACVVVTLLWWRWYEPLHRRGTIYRTRSEWREAETRAKGLLREILTEEEYRQFGRRGYLEIPSPNIPNRVYRIPKGRGRIGVYESGRRVMSLCIGPVSSIPRSDVLLTHKLMIEGNEAEYIHIANRF